MTETRTPREFFEDTLQERFKPEKAKGIDITVQADISGSNGGSWVVTIKDQKIEAKEGTHESPTLTVGMTDTDFMDVINSRLSAEKAFFSGKIKFKGNLSVALKLKDIGFL
jgi:putative sterol carrier protein